METLLTIALSNAIIATGMALVAVLVGRMIRRPALMHALWLLVLLKLFTPPLISIPVQLPVYADDEMALQASSISLPPPQSDRLDEGIPVVVIPEDPAVPEREPVEAIAVGKIVVSSEELLQKGAQSPPPTPVSWEWLLWLWLGGSLCWLVLALYRGQKFYAMLSFAEPPPEWLSREVEELAQQLGLQKSPEVLLMPGRLSPMIWGFGRARLLLPKQLLGALSPEQRKAVILHELAHYYRGDHRARWLELLSRAIYWWHPVVWWAGRELREAEEQCCDAWVVWALPEHRRSYATALVECLDFLSGSPAPLPLGASGIGQVSDLKKRVRMIMSRTTPRRLTWMGCFAILGLGALLLPILPTWADEKKAVKIFVEDEKEGNLQAQIEKLRALLKKQSAQMKETAARLKEAEARLNKGKGKIDKGKVDKGTKVESRTEMKIVIVGPDGKQRVINLKGGKGELPKWIPGGKLQLDNLDFLKKLPKVQAEKIREALKKLPKEEEIERRIRLKLSGEDGGTNLKELLQKLMKEGIQERIELELKKDKPAPKGGHSQEKRIRNLEQKLEQLMKELQKLRKDMSRKGAAEGFERAIFLDELGTYLDFARPKK